MNRNRNGRMAAIALTASLLTAGACATAVRQGEGNDLTIDALAAGFRDPPHGNRPQIWLFRLGEKTPDSVISYDFSQLASAGIGGVCIYGYGEVTASAPYGRYALADRPEMVEKLRFALREAGRTGLDVSICIGAVGCGNELTTPDNAQKSLVLSSAPVRGGAATRLPKSKVKHSPPDSDGFPAHWHDIGVYAARIDGGFASESGILDVSRFLDAATGMLEWTAPSGDWVAVRASWVPRMFGFSGCCIDPLSREAFDEHWRNTVQPLLDAATGDELKSLKGVMCDSWEGGEVSWTQRFPCEFSARRGYPVTPALFAKAGIKVANDSRNAELIRDFDETVSELFAENGYAYQREVANRHGLESETEACGPHQRCGDVRRMQSRSDIAVGEFWMPSPHRPTPTQRFMLRDAATAAHVYGMREVRAEAFTTMGTHWEESPAMLKPCADRAFCDGLTRIAWHGMPVSDPPDELPGVTRRAGVYYSPKVTWFPYSRPLNTYFARCSWMLSQGRFHADCLLYAGDANGYFANMKTPYDALGPGFDYDVCPTEALLSARVENGDILLPSGMRYRVLFVSDKNSASMDMRPGRRTSSAADATYPSQRWPMPESARRKLALHKAAGAVVLETRAERDEWLSSSRPVPDFATEGLCGNAIDWIHRTSEKTEIYFVSNQGNESASFRALFRQPPCPTEQWDAVTGARRRIFPEPTGNAGDPQVRVPVELPPGGSAFIVFAKNATPSETDIPIASVGSRNRRTKLPTAFEVAFDAKFGGPPEPVAIDISPEAKDWTLNPDPRIRFYSGTATYRMTFDVPDAESDGDAFPGVISFGNVRDVAEVSLNGERLGVIWTPPYEIAATNLRSRANSLEVKVSNLWMNRLIGDASLPPSLRVARTDRNPFSAEAALRPSGLWGPLNLVR